MKMNKIKVFFATALILASLSQYAQTSKPKYIPDEEPEMLGDILNPAEDMEWINPLVLSEKSLSKELPDFVDNSLSPYFPAVIYQKGNSSLSAAEIGYCLTYEINRIKDVHPDRKIAEYFSISFDDNYESLATLKHWIADHGNGEENGGLAIFAANISGYKQAIIPEGPYAGELYLSDWGNSGGQAMTIVGYDENVLCDSNDDGIYNITEDINGDGDVNLKDREVGAFKVVNSFGTGFGNEGFIWVPYRLIAGGLLHSNKVYVVRNNL